MIRGLRKIFGGIRMTWLRVILFAVITAAVTAGIMILPYFRDNALRQMGVGFECWIVFAIFVVSNCEKRLEAGFKCFVFFLISQPLIYLFQQPFASINLLKTYYFYWFIWTLLTFPGAMIAFQIKRKGILSALILAVAGVFLGGFCSAGLVAALFDGGNVSNILYNAFFIVFAILLGFIFCTERRDRVLYLVLVLAAIIGMGAYTYVDKNGAGSFEYDIQQEGSWQPSGSGSTNMNIRQVDEDTIYVKYARSSEGWIEYENENGEILRITITVVKGKYSVSEEVRIP